MRPMFGYLFSSLLMAVAVNPGAAEEPGYSADMTLSLLRGSWQRHTYREKWVLAFDSDTKMRIDFEPATYSVDSEMIRIRTAERELDYRYTLEADRLSVTDPGGIRVAFDRDRAGVQEQRVDGSFYAPSDSQPGTFITFDEGRYFSYRDRYSGVVGGNEEASKAGSGHEGVFTPDGVFRVQGGFIILDFYTGGVWEAGIRDRDPDGNVVEILFDGRFYGKDQFLYLPPVLPLPCVHEYLPLIPLPEPPIPWTPPAGRSENTQPIGQEKHERTFGNTRGTPSDQSTSGRDEAGNNEPQRRENSDRGAGGARANASGPSLSRDAGSGTIQRVIAETSERRSGSTRAPAAEPPKPPAPEPVKIFGVKIRK